MNIFARFLNRNPKKMSADMASYTNCISSIHSPNEELKQLENSRPSETEQSGSGVVVENDSNLEANLSEIEAEVSVSDNTQSTRSTNGDTHESVDKGKEEEEWLDILGSGQLKKKVSTVLNTQCSRSKCCKLEGECNG